jgi:hypothetical protein
MKCKACGFESEQYYFDCPGGKKYKPIEPMWAKLTVADRIDLTESFDLYACPKCGTVRYGEED